MKKFSTILLTGVLGIAVTLSFSYGVSKAEFGQEKQFKVAEKAINF
ncbi:MULTISPECIES: hypothetical protein [Bacillus]|uniref:Phr family secreted Rap phosphatase inhibitor n=1 Tax=Bacillus sonorensis TaxID=119858 RepID=A0ABN5AGV3_9BACI|nr:MULTISPECIES: hypothetical protein [Bacillus]ASB88413.1 hypothetical protein S101395_01905 [Bacillus sonorensis]NWN81130.1 hypothetical protein [Bacillus sp. (in: firmicutes)]GIN67658.1 hypothetical protein J41TS2_30790 [Bacillus sonorensis]